MTQGNIKNGLITQKPYGINSSKELDKLIIDIVVCVPTTVLLKLMSGRRNGTLLDTLINNSWRNL